MRPRAIPGRVVYVVRSWTGLVLYVGVTGDMTKRMAVHSHRRTWGSTPVEIEVAPETDNLEAILIDRYRPIYNRQPNYLIWWERSDELCRLHSSGLRRSEIIAATGVPENTLINILADRRYALSA